jgi:hypothetical protein
LGERDPRALTELAQQQLDTGRAALANDPQLAEKAAKLLTARVKAYTDTAEAGIVLEQYDFTKHFGRLAFALACLPEQLRNKVLHDVYKSMCIWIGKSGTWEEDTPGTVLLAGRNRLQCKDTAIAVLHQVQDELLETCPASEHDAVFAEYAECLKTYLTEVFVTAQEQLDDMKAELEEINATGILDQLRNVVKLSVPLHDDGDAETDVIPDHEAAHPRAGQLGAICSGFKHPSKQYSDAPCQVIDWEDRYSPIDDFAEDEFDVASTNYSLRTDLYSIPDDGAAVLVKITDGDYAGDLLVVHDSELTY